MESKTQQIFKQDAKSIVDAMYNGKLFKDNITRDDMNAVQEYIEFAMQSRYDSYKRIESILGKIEDRPAPPQPLEQALLRKQARP